MALTQKKLEDLNVNLPAKVKELTASIKNKNQQIDVLMKSLEDLKKSLPFDFIKAEEIANEIGAIRSSLKKEKQNRDSIQDAIKIINQ